MKREFSKFWKSSKQPRKQRKYRYNIPKHLLKKFISVNLSKELRVKYSKRNIPIKKGDTVKILRGQFKKKIAKVMKVLPKKSKVYLENIQNIRKDGTKSFYPIHTSNLQITELLLDDRKRKNILERKNGKKSSVKTGSTKNLADKKENK